MDHKMWILEFSSKVCYTTILEYSNTFLVIYLITDFKAQGKYKKKSLILHIYVSVDTYLTLGYEIFYHS